MSFVGFSRLNIYSLGHTFSSRKRFYKNREKHRMNYIILFKGYGRDLYGSFQTRRMDRR